MHVQGDTEAEYEPMELPVCVCPLPRSWLGVFLCVLESTGSVGGQSSWYEVMHSQ